MSGLFVPTQMVLNARNDVGFVERPPHSNINPYSFWQYGDYREPYCDSAVCYWAWHAGFRFHGSDHGDRGYSWVTAHRRAAQAQGIWRDRSHTARAGWLVVFSFTLPDQHIEMVLSDQGGATFATIGGNTGDGVFYRLRYRQNVVGSIALDEAGQNLANPIPPPAPLARKEEPMLFRPPYKNITVNRLSGSKVDIVAAHIGTSGDTRITPDPATVTIKQPWAGAYGHEQNPVEVQPGQFVVVGADLAEYKFTLTRA